MSTCAPPPDPLRCPVLAHSRLALLSEKKSLSGRRQEPASRASAGFASKMPYPVPGHILDTACQEAPQEGPSSDDRNPATGPTASPPFQPHLAPLTAAPLRTPSVPPLTYTRTQHPRCFWENMAEPVCKTHFKDACGSLSTVARPGKRECHQVGPALRVLHLRNPAGHVRLLVLLHVFQICTPPEFHHPALPWTFMVPKQIKHRENAC